jgi:hypothetical protein
MARNDPGRALLRNIFYGDELAKFPDSIKRNAPMLVGEGLAVPAAEALSEVVEAYFRRRHGPLFDGEITAGDAAFMLMFMEAIRPHTMVEIGVAAGFSSLFIMETAARLGLVRDRIFLDSFDLYAVRETGEVTGSYAAAKLGDLSAHWKLNSGLTSLDLVREGRPRIEGPALGFIDGCHEHPWPLIDLIVMHLTMPAGTWILMQDYQIMERWIADSLRWTQLECPAPIRGVNLAVSLWPGTKVIGLDGCYNMAAVKLDASSSGVMQFITKMTSYPFERVKSSTEVERLQDALSDLAARLDTSSNGDF